MVEERERERVGRKRKGGQRENKDIWERSGLTMFLEPTTNPPPFPKTDDWHRIIVLTPR